MFIVNVNFNDKRLPTVNSSKNKNKPILEMCFKTNQPFFHKCLLLNRNYFHIYLFIGIKSSQTIIFTTVDYKIFENTRHKCQLTLKMATLLHMRMSPFRK